MLSYEEKAERAKLVRGKRVKMSELKRLLPETWVLLKDVVFTDRFQREIESAFVIEVETSRDWEDVFADIIERDGVLYITEKTTPTPGVRW